MSFVNFVIPPLRLDPPPPPHQPMPAYREPALGQPLFPALAGADQGRVVEQAVLFLLPGQPGEPGCERMAGREEPFLAVEDGGLVLSA